MTPKHHLGLLSDAQLISLLLIIAGVVLLLVRRGKPAFKSAAATSSLR